MDDVAVNTIFISETQLRITIPSSYTEQTSVHMIKVRNPDGRLSSEMAFAVKVPEPYISSVVPGETDLNSGAKMLEISGSGFLPTTKVYYDDRERPVTYINETRLQVTLMPEDISTAGEYKMYAVNTNYDGTVARSNNFQFTVNNPLPVVSSITPAEVMEDSPATVITIHGSGFVSGADVYLNGQAITVNSYTYSSITVTVSPSMLKEAGEYPLIVQNPPPGGGLSNEAVLAVKPALKIDILYPADGTTMNRVKTMVRGTFKAETEDIGVVVNGVVADIVGNEWVANGVQLNNGQNTITATITDNKGSSAISSIEVNTTEAAQPVRLSASITSGTPPLPIYFNIESAFEPAGYEMDFDGDGVIDYSGTTFEGINHTYSTEGIYTAMVSVTDTAGNEYSDSIMIVVLPRQQIDTLLRQKWEGMKEALMNQDVDGAVEYFSSVNQQLYRETYTALIDRLPDIAQMMQEIELIYVQNNTAKYRIKKTELYGGSTYTFTYYIYFTRDSNGIWRIYRY